MLFSIDKSIPVEKPKHYFSICFMFSKYSSLYLEKDPKSMQTKFIPKKYHGYTESFFPKHGLYLDNGKGHFTTACYSAFSKKIYFKRVFILKWKEEWCKTPHVWWGYCFLREMKELDIKSPLYFHSHLTDTEMHKKQLKHSSVLLYCGMKKFE